MALERLFFLAGIKIGATYLSHVAGQSINNQLEDLTVFPAGHAFPRMTGSKSWSPEITVEGTDLASIITLLGSAPQIVADLRTGNVDLYYREAKQHGVNESVSDTGKHQVYRGQLNACLYWDTLQASQDDDAAQWSLRILLQKAGANDPVQVPAVALDAAGVQVAPWTVGPWAINGTQIKGITSARIALNPEIERRMGDGDAIPTFASIKTVRPVVTLETTDLRAVAALDREGVAVTELLGYFRRRRPSKLLYADNEAQHVKFAAVSGTAKWQETSGDPATARIEIALHETPGSDLFALTSGQTISLDPSPSPSPSPSGP